ncbi:MAG: efflux RND transporter periplasmic adaptor subunit [Bacteroidia bacterium]|nr:efflux RND transporter periplasmic adaptor subunit [Bacteroidia bacterium]HQV00879.1 efflux RND transporter periplasmic adaptor subunit [Bacteroidia bacterium]
MKSINIIVAIAALAIITACGNKSVDKKTELENLLKQQNELSAKIDALRTELEKAGDSTVSGNIKNISTIVIKTDTFNHYVDVQGKVDANQSINANAQMQGNITAILVKEGDKVSAGQVLARIDDALLRQGLNEVKTQLDFATNIYNKQKALWEQQIGSEVQYLTAKNNMESLARKHETMREQWAMTQIKSPISGTVDQVDIKLGQSIMPGMPCIHVVNLSGLKIKAEVAESYIAKVNKGDKTRISIPDLGIDFESNVSYASTVVNPINRTFMVEVALPKADARLRPNMLSIMHVVDYTNANAVTVPVNVIQKGQNSNYVLIAETKDGKIIVAKKDVIVGLTYSGVAEITSGLNNGDEVITVGYQDVNIGEAVKK